MAIRSPTLRLPPAASRRLGRTAGAPGPAGAAGVLKARLAATPQVSLLAPDERDRRITQLGRWCEAHGMDLQRLEDKLVAEERAEDLFDLIEHAEDPALVAAFCCGLSWDP